jgi:hypothetical protein
VTDACGTMLPLMTAPHAHADPAQRVLTAADLAAALLCAGRHVDATSYYELEAEEYRRKGVTLTPELWLVKLMVGAIDPT